MAYKWEDGTGTRNKVAVFKDRLRTFAEEHSLVNFNSVKSGNITNEAILNGEVIGVFTVRAFNNIALLATGQTIPSLNITNNDPINLLVIDRAYIHIISADLTLPRNLIITTDRAFSGSSLLRTPIPIINDHQYSNIIPLVTAFSNRSSVVQALTTNNIPRIFGTVGNIDELILPGSDAIILTGGPNPTGVATTFNVSNSFSLSIFNNSGSNFGISYNMFVRFMMVHPGDTG